MPTAAVTTGQDDAAIAALRRVDRTVAEQTGHEAFPEQLWTALAESPGACRIALTADGAAAIIPSDTFAPSHRQLVAAAPAHASGAALTAAITALLGTDEPSIHVEAWVPGSDPTVISSLQQAGFVASRTQLQMEVGLPLRSQRPELPDGIAVRVFRPGVDNEAWLRVNNAAFSNHPDQGGWIESVLARRMAEPWFDPDGFLLAWRGSTLVGSCWTKVHDGDEPVGEIFVIGVDPAAHGQGLGRALVIAGLDDLNRRRACRRGLLYVAADNDAAVALYTSLGFVPRRTDTALTFDRKPS